MPKTTSGSICPVCGRIFACRYNMNRHVKDQHETGGYEYQCTFDGCTMREKQPDNVKTHYRSAQ